MDITIITKSGLSVRAPAERWLCGLIAILDDAQLTRLCELVGGRVELAGPERPNGHIIKVPGIDSDEKFGKV